MEELLLNLESDEGVRIRKTDLHKRESDGMIGFHIEATKGEKRCHRYVTPEMLDGGIENIAREAKLALDQLRNVAIALRTSRLVEAARISLHGN